MFASDSDPDLELDRDSNIDFKLIVIDLELELPRHGSSVTGCDTDSESRTFHLCNSNINSRRPVHFILLVNMRKAAIFGISAELMQSGSKFRLRLVVKYDEFLSD